VGDDEHDTTHDGRTRDGSTRDGTAESSAGDVRRPSGGVYEWLSRGRQLLAAGDAGAAAVLLRHAHAEEPGSPELVETLARAEFDSGRFGAARDLFATLVEVSPDSDYAHFGLGASLVRMGRHREAVPHLVIAAVMRPDRPEYQQLLDRARAVGGGGTDDDR
jgi:Flp pilus assembly protein TadD